MFSKISSFIENIKEQFRKCLFDIKSPGFVFFICNNCQTTYIPSKINKYGDEKKGRFSENVETLDLNFCEWIATMDFAWNCKKCGKYLDSFKTKIGMFHFTVPKFCYLILINKDKFLKMFIPFLISFVLFKSFVFEFLFGLLGFLAMGYYYFFNKVNILSFFKNTK